jgi:hypothetical protein
MLSRRVFLLSSGAAAAALASPGVNPRLLTNRWAARWIAVPGAPAKAYGVYHFRRAFNLASAPSSFKLHVTGDNRYQLYVNGERVVWGPARGDLFHWRYETVDVAKWLKPGRNVLAAVVWNDGEHAALSQISNRTGFLLQGDGDAEQAVNTGRDWKCIQNTAYKAYPITPENRVEYWAVGPGEEIDAASYPWGWEKPDFDDSSWQAPLVMREGSPREGNDGPNHWMLVSRPIPLMEETPEPLPDFKPFTVAPNSKQTVVLHLGRLTTAFPELTVSGGRGARITLKYVEGPRGPKKFGEKPRRDKAEGTLLVGNEDVFVADGAPKRLFRPLFWRCYRFIEITAETKAEPLTVDGLRGIYTGYPFKLKAKFEGGPADLQQILEVGWRTARLCAHETYMDTPYYEQLQYAGDTRIQALVSIFNSGDHRLMRNAIEQLDSSRTPEGATFSRAPSALQQYIPPFSLWWIGMLHDYWMYVDDPQFVADMLPGVRAVLGFFSRYQRPDGRLKKMPWWNYVDWTERGKWPTSAGPANEDGLSAIHELQLLLAYQWAAQLESAIGEKMFAEKYGAEARKLGETIRKSYWDASRGLFADTMDRKYWSQHSNSLAVLAGLVEGAEAKTLMEKVLADNTLVPASIYFTYYVRLAMLKAGLGDRYLAMLDHPWRWALSYGFTTWPEHDNAGTRSDCHAWGSSPNIELFRTVLGIDTGAAAFRRVVVRPHLGDLTTAGGTIPHPKGAIEVRYTKAGARLQASVTLPAGVAGEFHWAGKRVDLQPGLNKVSV